MDGDAQERYEPVYPTDYGIPGKNIQSFITNFYRISDNPEENERWINTFTKDAQVQIGADKAHGSFGEFRSTAQKHSETW